MTIPEAGFAVFLIFIFVVGFAFLVAIMAENDSPLVDTYGNTQNEVTNSTHQVGEDLFQNESLTVPLILIVSVVFLVMVLFAIWLASRYFT